MNLELQQSSQNQVDSSSIFNGIEGAEMSNKGKDQGRGSEQRENGHSGCADRPEKKVM